MEESRMQTLNQRQTEMLETCMDTCDNVAYPFMALIEEVGELAEKVDASIEWTQWSGDTERAAIRSYLNDLIHVSRSFRLYAKAIRHGVKKAPFELKRGHEARVEIAYEIGDVDWDLQVLANNIGFSSQEIADWNHEKLMKRQKKNEIDGNGDHERTAID